MSLPFAASPKSFTVTVFRGSLATLLRAGKVAVPSTFVSEDLTYTATLDQPTYKLLMRSPLLHQHVLLTVGERMSSKVATGLAQEFKQTGKVGKDSIVLKVAENQVQHWTQQAIQEQGPGLHAWRKVRLANGVQVLKCAFSLTTAGMGLASAAATFGATSIPAVFAAWSALSETAGFLARAWQDVQGAERAALRQLEKIYKVYGAYKAGSKSAGPIPASTSGTGSRFGAHVRSMGDSTLHALKLDTVTAPFGRTLGPSVSDFRSAIANYEGKLAHLIAEANKLTAILVDLLDTTRQLSLSQAGDESEIAAREDEINRMIGDERGSIGVTRKRDMFRGPVSILWLQAYYKVGKETAFKMRHELADLLQNTPLNQLDAQQRTADLLVTMGKWFGGNADALNAGSFSAFSDKLFKQDNAISVDKIGSVLTTIQGWGKQAVSVSAALRRQYPSETNSDLAKDCKVDYMAAAKDSVTGGIGVYDTARTNFAPNLPDLATYTSPTKLAGMAAGKIIPDFGA